MTKPFVKVEETTWLAIYKDRGLRSGDALLDHPQLIRFESMSPKQMQVEIPPDIIIGLGEIKFVKHAFLFIYVGFSDAFLNCHKTILKKTPGDECGLILFHHIAYNGLQSIRKDLRNLMGRKSSTFLGISSKSVAIRLLKPCEP